MRSRFEAEGHVSEPTCNENSRRGYRRITNKKSIAKTVLTSIGCSPDFFPEKNLIKMKWNPI
jgi:hypothetical protein